MSLWELRWSMYWLRWSGAYDVVTRSECSRHYTLSQRRLCNLTKTRVTNMLDVAENIHVALRLNVWTQKCGILSVERKCWYYCQATRLSVICVFLHFHISFFSTCLRSVLFETYLSMQQLVHSVKWWSSGFWHRVVLLVDTTSAPTLRHPEDTRAGHPPKRRC
jgi:hypothetical protein